MLAAKGNIQTMCASVELVSLPLSYNQTIVISKTKTLKVCFTDAERERHSLQLIKPFFLRKKGNRNNNLFTHMPT